MSIGSKIKSKLKKGLGYVAIGIGTVGVATIGFTGLQFQNEVKGNARNYIRLQESPGILAVVGDTGLDSPQRRAILADLKLLCEEAVEKKILLTIVVPGDPVYPFGPKNTEEYAQHIEPFKNICPANKYTIFQLGNHNTIGLIGKDYMSGRHHGKPFQPGINALNYYWALEWGAELWVFNESTIYDALIDPPIEQRQEDFTEWALEQTDKTATYFAHHGFKVGGDRKPKKDYLKYFSKLQKLKHRFVNFLTAHDHFVWTSFEYGQFHGTSGMGAKTTRGPLAYIIKWPGEFPRVRMVEGPVTDAGKDDD